jgi:hypothetical protein
MHDFFNAIIVIAIIAGIVYLRSLKHHAGAGERLSGSSRERLPQSSRERELEDEVAELRRRIAVLERIATDERHGRNIAAEIDALRD